LYAKRQRGRKTVTKRRSGAGRVSRKPGGPGKTPEIRRQCEGKGYTLRRKNRKFFGNEEEGI